MLACCSSEHDKVAVMPRRVVPHVRKKKVVGVRKLVVPEVGVVQVGQKPLAVAPGMVVLGVHAEDASDEAELPPCDFERLRGRLLSGRWFGDVRDEQSTVVPDLVRLHVVERNLVHDLELCVQRGIDSDERAVAVLPAQA